MGGPSTHRPSVSLLSRSTCVQRPSRLRTCGHRPLTHQLNRATISPLRLRIPLTEDQSVTRMSDRIAEAHAIHPILVRLLRSILDLTGLITLPPLTFLNYPHLTLLVPIVKPLTATGYRSLPCKHPDPPHITINHPSPCHLSLC